jgi:ribosomal protein L32
MSWAGRNMAESDECESCGEMKAVQELCPRCGCCDSCCDCPLPEDEEELWLSKLERR